MSEVAVFGGTFDPPTLAHEAIIKACLDRSDMDEVWVMPSGQRLDKPGMMSNNERLEMLKIMSEESFLNHDKLIVTDFEINLPQPTRTIDTFKQLEQQFPNKNFWFVFGADSYRTMESWEGGSYLKRYLGMLIVERVNEIMPEEKENVRHLKVPGVLDFPISSTQVREAVKNNLPIDSFVSQAINNYLTSNRCYNR